MKDSTTNQWRERKETPPSEVMIQIVGHDWSPFSCIGMMKKNNQGKTRFHLFNRDTKSFRSDKDSYDDRSSWRVIDTDANMDILINEGLLRAQKDLQERLNKRHFRDVYNLKNGAKS